MKTQAIRFAAIITAASLCLLCGALTLHAPARSENTAGQAAAACSDISGVNAADTARFVNEPPDKTYAAVKTTAPGAAFSAAAESAAAESAGDESADAETAEAEAADAETAAAETAAAETAEQSRYDALTLGESDTETLARLVYLEARGEPYEGQVAVAEVVLNRMLSQSFPDTLEGVIYQRGQFTPAERIAQVSPSDEQYEAVADALDGAEYVTAEDVVFFSGAPYNDKVYAVIGGHYFCRY